MWTGKVLVNIFLGKLSILATLFKFGVPAPLWSQFIRWFAILKIYDSWENPFLKYLINGDERMVNIYRYNFKGSVKVSEAIRNITHSWIELPNGRFVLLLKDVLARAVRLGVVIGADCCKRQAGGNQIVPPSPPDSYLQLRATHLWFEEM